jgi:peroxiredoxin
VLPAKVEFAAPDLTLTDLSGAAVSLADWRGQVVLVNNWATWCPPCKAEMPELQAYYQAHRQRGFVVFAIEAGEPLAEVTAFADRYRLAFPVWVDEESAALEAFQNWDLPSSYVIDPYGIVRLAWVGPINRETLEQYVTPLLGE